MKAKTTLMSSTTVLIMASLVASAEEMSSSFSWGNVTFQPRAYVGYADYELKSGNFNFSQNGEIFRTAPIGFFLTSPGFSDVDKIQFSGVLGGIGGTVASGPFFGDFYYQSTANEVANSSQGEFVAYPNINYPNAVGYTNSSYGDGNAKHADWALSLGYMVTDQWSVFAGYKSGKTDWDQLNSYRSDLDVILDDVAAYGKFSKGIKISGDFKQSGPFLGTAYSLAVGPGVLTFKVAYAYLDGTEKLSINQVFYYEPPFPNDYYDLSHKLDGNSNAFSLGVSWTQSLTDDLGMSVGANYHRYKFNLSGGGATNSFNGESIGGPIEISGGSLTESLFTLTASIIYRF
ncbi:MAG: hypothetical protein H6969_12235 [Gammaproteobacteria bacterium]|nr:hypothetical protein [Candidatus Competibacteraceae bacterium]MCP5421238.1 hypothetical protein [Gammaproteobacteria bacterium]